MEFVDAIPAFLLLFVNRFDRCEVEIGHFKHQLIHTHNVCSTYCETLSYNLNNLSRACSHSGGTILNEPLTARWSLLLCLAALGIVRKERALAKAVSTLLYPSGSGRLVERGCGTWGRLYNSRAHYQHVTPGYT